MKIIILTIAVINIFLTTIQAQHSTYYNVDINQNANVNINQNVNVSGTVYEQKTIRTIDYGALQLANAQKEKNKLERIIYANQEERRMSLEIASNPVKAYDYGNEIKITKKGKSAKQFGFKSFTLNYIAPHKSLFVFTGAGNLENTSVDGITTEIIIVPPLYNTENIYEYMGIDSDVEKIAKMENIEVGQLNERGNGEIFVHKKEVNRATVFGIKGFKSTLIFEDDYQYCITDKFQAYDPLKKNGVYHIVQVNTYGSKNEVSFEQLEGRRYYLRQLIEKIISTAMVYDIKY